LEQVKRTVGQNVLRTSKEVQSVKGFAVGSGSQKTHVRCIQVANGCYTEWWELVTTVEQGDERCKTTVFSS